MFHDDERCHLQCVFHQQLNFNILEAKVYINERIEKFIIKAGEFNAPSSPSYWQNKPTKYSAVIKLASLS